LSEERLKIAVFIDFDNIEIGVKTTLGSSFDVGAVLEALKERGEVVTKSAYGDWTRAGDYGRAMSQHAIHMVQRNLTPGGDKNGADINLALDALEMAFTHNHINAFVIVGGDSDFISLVEKLKQYDRKVFVVGGRAFTSMVMQKNCTEFIAYENLTRRGGGRGGRQVPETELSRAMPLVRRALKLLADREVVPQLGLLKSTLLQLDSAFSEREYGASSFRDFVQKLAKAGLVLLKGSDRSFHVELREGREPESVVAADTVAATASVAPPIAAPPAAPVPEGPADEASPRPGAADGFRAIQQAFEQASIPRWPLYVRQVKQVLKSADERFDERRYGFAGIIDALRHCQREGLFRLDRDRQGVVRVYPGTLLQRPGTPLDADEGARPAPGTDASAAEATELGPVSAAASPGPAQLPLEVDLTIGDDPPAPVDVAPASSRVSRERPAVEGMGEAVPAGDAGPSGPVDTTGPTRSKGHGRKGPPRGAKTIRKAAAQAPPRARKTAAAQPEKKPAAPSRGRTRPRKAKTDVEA
jgi:uncharacterized LabA/DUF88 family protein